MIALLEPPRPAGFISGGYRYQDAIGRRIVQWGHGQYLALPPSELAQAVVDLRARTPGAVLVEIGRAHV